MNLVPVTSSESMDMVSQFSDQDSVAVLNRAMRTVGVIALIVSPILWIAAGWRSMVLFLVGSAIAATGLLEWRQLVSVILSRISAGATPRPMARVLLWFFLRLGGAVILLYVSLRSLDGSVYALLAGLALAVFALFIEAIRLLRIWSL